MASTVFEVGGTSIFAASNIWNLMRSLSVDNVQPLALAAAHELGAIIPFSDQLLHKAILALKGNESFRIENLKTVIGLSQGGTVKALRESTPLIAFFLLVTAWRPCYTNSDLGDLIYHMLAESGLLKRYPVASFQLCDLIQSFSGHSETLLPIDLMSELAVEIDKHAPNEYDFCRLIDKAALAKLLVRIFELLIDTSIDTITVSGRRSALWLATFFCFVIPETTVLSINGKVVRCSKQTARLKLELTTSLGGEAWTIKEWRKERVTKFVIPEVAISDDQCSYIPLKLTKHYLTELHVRSWNTPSRQSAISAIGAVAGALIVFLSEFGSIYHSESCCERSDTKCKRVSLIEIFLEDWTNSYESILKRYGWDDSDSFVANQEQLVEILQTEFRRAERSSRDGKIIWDRLKSRIKVFLETRLLLRGHGTYQLEVLACAASYVAIDAITTAICHFESGTRRIAPLCYKNSGFAEDCISAFLSCNGMEFSEYRRHCLAQVLPGNAPFDDLDVVISSNGYVAALGSLWEKTMRKDKALMFRVFPGGIKRDEISYSSVREEIGRSQYNICMDRQDYLEMFRDGKYLGVVPRCEEKNPTLETVVAVFGTRLHMKSCLNLYNGTSISVSWTDSVRELLFAKHITDQSGFTLRQEEELAKRNLASLSRVYWKSCYILDYRDKTILKTFANPDLRFFSSGLVCRQRRILDVECSTLIVQHSGQLLCAMIEGEYTGGPWTVIC